MDDEESFEVCTYVYKSLGDLRLKKRICYRANQEGQPLNPKEYETLFCDDHWEIDLPIEGG